MSKFYSDSGYQNYLNEALNATANLTAADEQINAINLDQNAQNLDLHAMGIEGLITGLPIGIKGLTELRPTFLAAKEKIGLLKAKLADLKEKGNVIKAGLEDAPDRIKEAIKSKVAILGEAADEAKSKLQTAAGDLKEHITGKENSLTSFLDETKQAITDQIAQHVEGGLNTLENIHQTVNEIHTNGAERMTDIFNQGIGEFKSQVAAALPGVEEANNLFEAAKSTITAKVGDLSKDLEDAKSFAGNVKTKAIAGLSDVVDNVKSQGERIADVKNSLREGGEEMSAKMGSATNYLSVEDKLKTLKETALSKISEAKGGGTLEDLSREFSFWNKQTPAAIEEAHARLSSQGKLRPYEPNTPLQGKKPTTITTAGDVSNAGADEESLQYLRRSGTTLERTIVRTPTSTEGEGMLSSIKGFMDNPKASMRQIFSKTSSTEGTPLRVMPTLEEEGTEGISKLSKYWDATKDYVKSAFGAGETIMQGAGALGGAASIEQIATNFNSMNTSQKVQNIYNAKMVEEAPGVLKDLASGAAKGVNALAQKAGGGLAEAADRGKLALSEAETGISKFSASVGEKLGISVGEEGLIGGLKSAAISGAKSIFGEVATETALAAVPVVGEIADLGIGLYSLITGIKDLKHNAPAPQATPQLEVQQSVQHGVY